MPEILNVGLLGCGRISKRHIEAIAANPGLALRHVCDIDAGRAETAARLSGANPTTRLADLRDCDVVAVATPSGFHPRHVMEIVDSTAARHIVCEKPVSLTVREMAEMYRAAEARGRTILPVYQNRYNPLVALLKRLIDQGSLGRVYQFNVNVLWNRNDDYFADGWHGTLEVDGGVLYTQASHYIDMLLFFFGELNDAKGFGGRMRGRPAQDTVSAVLQFRSGTVGTLNATISVYRKNYLTEATIVCERGTIRVSGTNLNTIEFWDVEGMDRPQMDFRIDHIYGKGHDTLYRYVAERRWEMFPGHDEVRRGIMLMEKLSF